LTSSWACVRCGQTFEFTADPEQMRAPRNVSVGLIQNAVVLPTTAPFLEQKRAIMSRVSSLIAIAAKMGVNVLCLQVPQLNRLLSGFQNQRWLLTNNLVKFFFFFFFPGSVDDAVRILHAGEELVRVCRER
jgi:uncharacterized protein (DUF3084 family)